jgi:transcriptional regulator with GAF, ATPase, and Fis domain
MTATRDLESVLRSITQGLVEHADAANARIWLYVSDDECDVCRVHGVSGNVPAGVGQTLHLCASAGFRNVLTGPHHRMTVGGEFGPGAVAALRAPFLVNDVQTRAEVQGDVPFLDFRVEEYGIHAGAGWPLISHGELLGVLGVLTTRPIEAEEFEHLGIFADQAATAIKGAQLFSELDRLRQRLASENAYLQEEIRHEQGFEEIVGVSPALTTVLRKVKQVAAVETTILVTGETGTGKELVARAIHQLSARRERAMIKVNCGAISPGLVESELFGHEKGAFTGALQRRIGRFELADRGTLFMDEVGELSPDVQVKLLRVLQEQEFERVGSGRPTRVDVRLVAATHRDLARDVAEGRFRADLFYRLNVFPIHLPPLRQRVEDIPLLVGHFLAHFQRKLAKPLRSLTPESMTRVLRYGWPGNIRELQNVIERACVLASSPVVEILDPLTADGLAAETSERLGTLEEMERAHILRALRSCRGVISGAEGAASILGLHPNTLRSRMERLGITRHDWSQVG